MGLKGIFSNNFETHDPGQQQNLTTHYYSAYYEQAKDTLTQIVRAKKFQIANIDDQYKEILIYSPKADIIVTFCQAGAHLVSIDFKVTTNYLLGLNRGAKLIGELYEELNKKLTLKQIGGFYYGK